MVIKLPIMEFSFLLLLSESVQVEKVTEYDVSLPGDVVLDKRDGVGRQKAES